MGVLVSLRSEHTTGVDTYLGEFRKELLRVFQLHVCLDLESRHVDWSPRLWNTRCRAKLQRSGESGNIEVRQLLCLSPACTSDTSERAS